MGADTLCHPDSVPGPSAVGKAAKGRSLVPLGGWHLTTLEISVKSEPLTMYLRSVRYLERILSDVAPADWLVPPQRQHPAIYIVRDGRDSLVSCAHYPLT